MNRILLEVIGVSHSNSQNGVYILILGVKGIPKYLPIVIGGTEAQSIIMSMEDVSYDRPLSHDLMKNLADTFSIKVTEVVISRFKDGMFYSDIHCEREGDAAVLDSRASDAIAIALRFNCPIYTFSNVIDEAGINSKDIDIYDADNDTDDKTSHTSIEELEIMLQEAVREEDYNAAAKLRDLIAERKKTSQP